VRTAVLGLNAWAVVAVVPFAHARIEPATAAPILALPALVIALGAWQIARGSVAVAAWTLLVGFPVMLTGAVALRPELRIDEAYSWLGLVLGVISTAAFGAGAALACSRPMPTRAAVARPLGEVAPIVENVARAWTRRVMLILGGVGALLLIAVAPSIGTSSQLETAWGDGESASEGALLAAVIAGAIATAALGAFIGPSLRASRSPPPLAARTRRTVAGLLLAVLVGALSYIALRLAE